MVSYVNISFILITNAAIYVSYVFIFKIIVFLNFSVCCVDIYLTFFLFFHSLGKDDNWSVFILGAIVLVALAYLIFKKIETGLSSHLDLFFSKIFTCQQLFFKITCNNTCKNKSYSLYYC